jgi:hypothetical protein
MIGKLEPVLVWCIGLHYQGPYLIGMKWGKNSLIISEPAW